MKYQWRPTNSIWRFVDTFAGGALSFLAVLVGCYLRDRCRCLKRKLDLTSREPLPLERMTQSDRYTLDPLGLLRCTS